MLVLQVTRGPDQGKRLQLEPGKTYTVGCNGDASLVLTDPLVLKGHCSLEVADGAVVLKNHTASAGTFVGDQKVSQASLKPNSTFRIGGTTLSIAPLPAAAPRPAAKPPEKPAAPDPLVGRIVGGYKLNELVGAGGMGKVYRATQLSLHRDVAFKVLRDQHVKDKGFRDLFINEARAAAQLVHPNVVQVYDAGNEGDLVFFSMEFLGQGSAEEILEKEKKIPWEKAILMVLEAAHGLAYAESKRIVHRDIKPDNLMLNEAGQVKIADLGLAKRGEGNDDAGVIGTPHFIPPEQAMGKDVDCRADIYSLGATFFRMATGRTLFTGKTAKEIVLKHIKEPPPAASSLDDTIPDNLDLVLAKMLAKDPDQRYQSATEVIAALEEICAHHGIKGSIIRKGVGKKVLIPLLLLLLVAGGTVFYLATKPEDPKKVAARDAALAAQKKAEEDARTKNAENERLAREGKKGEAERKLLRYENTKGDLRVEVPLSSVYTDPLLAPQRELKWLDLARDFEEFAQGPAKEFEAELELSSKALRHATEIRESLKKWHESTEDFREKRDAKVKEATGIDVAQRRELSALRVASKYEKAANLCELIATGKPAKDDPFGPIITWEWVSPDKTLRQAALDFPEIKSVVDDARKYFAGEKQRIIDEAKQVGEAAIEAAKALPDEADPEAIQNAIKKLQDVREFVDEENKDRKEEAIQTLVATARDQQDRLARIQKQRGGKLVQADRTAVRDLQRRLSSLDPGQQPNCMMRCEFQDAIAQWNSKLVGDEIKTDPYRRFAKERIAMAGWCEFLFARFYADLEVTAKGVDPKPLTTLAVDRVPFPDKDLPDALLTAKDSSRYKFALSKAYNGASSWDYAQFPMDWVYNSIFQHKGASRWVEMTPDIHFALGALCFETMQYKDAARHFEEVLKTGDQRLGAAARSFKGRAELEAKARQAYESLLGEFEAAKTAAAMIALRDKVNGYAADHEGTLFGLDVMDPKDDVKIDFYRPEFVDPPPAPPPPEPRHE